MKKGSRAKDLEDSLEWLLSAGLVHRVMKIEKPAVPLAAFADQTFFKLYMADIGLLRKMAELPASAIFGEDNSYREFKGALTENFVLLELLSLQEKPIYYWKSKNIAEVDFISMFETDIIPFEVKAGMNLKARSLAEYRKKYSPRIAVKTSMRNVSCGEILHLPLYLLWKLKDYL